MRILHLASDEKFINSASWFFERAFPESNDIRIIIPSKAYSVKYVTLNESMTLTVDTDEELYAVAREIPGYSMIVLHGLTSFNSKLILVCDDVSHFLWLLWGTEVYSNPKITSSAIYGKKTFRLHFNRLTYPLKNLMRPVWHRLIKGESDINTLRLKAIGRLEAVGILYREEFDYFVTRKIVRPDMHYIRFTYGPFDTLIKDKAKRISGSNILLGNSASPANNHLEAFEKLSAFDLTGRRVIVPLSYGSESYRQKISIIGKKMFGDNFAPLTEFMLEEEYEEVISSCSIVIMNHYRQQALGNILIMLWFGAKIYLDKRSTVYSYLKRAGFIFFDIDQDLDVTNPISLELLDNHKVLYNREIMIKEIGLEVLLNDFKKGISILVKDVSNE